MKRWLPIVGGISLNLALGSLYAWSVFVLPLEKEFGWNRAQTSWVYTIAIVCFAATFIVAGKLQDAKGPRICAFLGALLVGGGFALSSVTTSLAFLYIAFGVIGVSVAIWVIRFAHKNAERLEEQAERALPGPLE